jgi:hypothetical protein
MDGTRINVLKNAITLVFMDSVFLSSTGSNPLFEELAITCGS